MRDRETPEQRERRRAFRAWREQLPNAIKLLRSPGETHEADRETAARCVAPLLRRTGELRDVAGTKYYVTKDGSYRRVQPK